MSLKGLLNTKAIFTTVRETVSRDRTRFEDEEFNLDLTYITDQLIAMALPASGLESAWRNHIDDVSALLRKRHGKNYNIWNLSQKTYDYAKFDHRIFDFGFQDHHAPPLNLLTEIILSMHSWLQISRTRVAVVHCVGGKGRTGTVICAYLLYTGSLPSPAESFKFFASKRSAQEKGVTQNSQQRYVRYFHQILLRRMIPHPKPFLIQRIVMKGIPAISNDGCNPAIRVFSLSKFGKIPIYSTVAIGQRPAFHHREERSIVWTIPDCLVRGDLLVKLYHYGKHGKKKLLRFTLHTAFVEEGALELTLADVDDIKMDIPRSATKRLTSAPKHIAYDESAFSITLYFGDPAKLSYPVPPLDQQDVADAEALYRRLFSEQPKEPVPLEVSRASRATFSTPDRDSSSGSTLSSPSPSPTPSYADTRRPSISSPPIPSFIFEQPPTLRRTPPSRPLPSVSASPTLTRASETGFRLTVSSPDISSPRNASPSPSPSPSPCDYPPATVSCPSVVTSPRATTAGSPANSAEGDVLTVPTSVIAAGNSVRSRRRLTVSTYVDSDTPVSPGVAALVSPRRSRDSISTYDTTSRSAVPSYTSPRAAISVYTPAASPSPAPSPNKGTMTPADSAPEFVPFNLPRAIPVRTATAAPAVAK